MFGKLVDSLPPGTRLFKGVTPGRALAILRFILEQIGTPRTLAIIRSFAIHVHDLPLYAHSTGAPTAKILLAGEWKPPAFLTYLDCGELETEAVLQA